MKTVIRIVNTISFQFTKAQSEKDCGPRQYTLMMAEAERGPVSSNFHHRELATELEVFPPEPVDISQTSPRYQRQVIAYLQNHILTHVSALTFCYSSKLVFLKLITLPCHHRSLFNVTLSPLFCGLPIEPFPLSPSFFQPACVLMCALFQWNSCFLLCMH